MSHSAREAVAKRRHVIPPAQSADPKANTTATPSPARGNDQEQHAASTHAIYRCSVPKPPGFSLAHVPTVRKPRKPGELKQESRKREKRNKEHPSVKALFEAAPELGLTTDDLDDIVAAEVTNPTIAKLQKAICKSLNPPKKKKKKQEEDEEQEEEDQHQDEEEEDEEEPVSPEQLENEENQDDDGSKKKPKKPTKDKKKSNPRNNQSNDNTNTNNNNEDETEEEQTNEDTTTATGSPNKNSSSSPLRRTKPKELVPNEDGRYHFCPEIDRGIKYNYGRPKLHQFRVMNLPWNRALIGGNEEAEAALKRRAEQRRERGKLEEDEGVERAAVAKEHKAGLRPLKKEEETERADAEQRTKEREERKAKEDAREKALAAERKRQEKKKANQSNKKGSKKIAHDLWIVEGISYSFVPSSSTNKQQQQDDDDEAANYKNLQLQILEQGEKGTPVFITSQASSDGTWSECNVGCVPLVALDDPVFFQLVTPEGDLVATGQLIPSSVEQDQIDELEEQEKDREFDEQQKQKKQQQHDEEATANEENEEKTDSPKNKDKKSPSPTQQKKKAPPVAPAEAGPLTIPLQPSGELVVMTTRCHRAVSNDPKNAAPPPTAKDEQESGYLLIHVKAASGLLDRDWVGTCDPFCRVTDGAGRMILMTPPVEGEKNPKWSADESSGSINVKAIVDDVLKVSVFDQDMGSDDDVLGFVSISVSELLASMKGGPEDKVFTLGPRDGETDEKLLENKDNLGKVTVSLEFVQVGTFAEAEKAAKAATKIQAARRGQLGRRTAKEKKENQDQKKEQEEKPKEEEEKKPQPNLYPPEEARVVLTIKGASRLSTERDDGDDTQVALVLRDASSKKALIQTPWNSSPSDPSWPHDTCGVVLKRSELASEMKTLTISVIEKSCTDKDQCTAEIDVEKAFGITSSNEEEGEEKEAKIAITGVSGTGVITIVATTLWPSAAVATQNAEEDKISQPVNGEVYEIVLLKGAGLPDRDWIGKSDPLPIVLGLQSRDKLYSGPTKDNTQDPDWTDLPHRSTFLVPYAGRFEKESVSIRILDDDIGEATELLCRGILTLDAIEDAFTKKLEEEVSSKSKEGEAAAVCVVPSVEMTLKLEPEAGEMDARLEDREDLGTLTIRVTRCVRKQQ